MVQVWLLTNNSREINSLFHHLMAIITELKAITRPTHQHSCWHHEGDFQWQLLFVRCTINNSKDNFDMSKKIMQCWFGKSQIIIWPWQCYKWLITYLLIWCTCSTMHSRIVVFIAIFTFLYLLISYRMTILELSCLCLPWHSSVAEWHMTVAGPSRVVAMQWLPEACMVFQTNWGCFVCMGSTLSTLNPVWYWKLSCRMWE